MIPSEFYSTVSNYPVGNTSGQFTEQQTKSVYTIYTETGSVSEKAYWLGWIKKENLPLNMQHNHWVVEGDGDSKTVKFINDTDLANFPCGYVKRDSYSYMYSTRFITDGVARSYDNSVWWTYFLNDLHPEYSAAVESSYFIITAIIALVYYKNSGVNVPRGYDEIWTRVIEFRQDAGYTLKDCIDFLEGNKTITITSHNINGSYYTFDITIDDDLKTLGYKEFTSNEDDNITMMYVLANIRLPLVVYRNGNSSDYFLTQFAAKITWTDNDNETSGEYNITNGSNYYNIIAAIIDGTISRYDDNSGAEGEFNYNELMRMGNDDYIINGNIFVANVYDRVRFYNIRNAADLLRAFSLIYRVDTSGYNTPVSSYVDGVTYATDVSSANEFLARLKTGNISDEEFRDGLRYWQYSSIANNDFDEDDVPPYEPEPEPDDNEEIGSTINRPPTLGVGGTLGFVTQYSLTATQVAALGRILWTSFLDPDYYKNFLFSLALDTGSFNMSSLLTYFISLRVYPFPLINVPSHAAAGSSMFVGAGTVPLAFSDTLHTINNYADYIDAGSLVVPRHYNDFRDYTDAEYMLYLPYCGTVQLNPGDVVGNTLSAQYAIDFATGACIAYVDLRTGDGHGYPIAALPGHIGADVPLTATNAGQVAAMLAGDAMHIAQTIGNVPATQISSGVAGFAAADTGNIAGATNSLIRSWTAPITAAGQYAQHLATMATRPAIGIPMLSGGRGFGAFGAPQTAYVQIRRGLYKQPDNYAHTVGYAATVSKKIGEAQGLITAYVDTSTLTATADEAAEITALLKSGVIV